MKGSNKLQRVIKLNKTTISMLGGGGGMGGNTVVNQEVSTGNNLNAAQAAERMAGGGKGGGNVVDGCAGGGGGNYSNLCTNSCNNIATCWTCQDPYYDAVHNINYPGTCTCPGPAGNTDTRDDPGTGVSCGCPEQSVNVTCNIQNCHAAPHEIGEVETWIDQIDDLTGHICDYDAPTKDCPHEATPDIPTGFGVISNPCGDTYIYCVTYTCRGCDIG